MLLSLQEIDAHFERSFAANLRTKGKNKGPFPEWNEFTTGMPNWMIRSSLFGTFGKGKGETYKNHVLASFRNMTLRYSGEQLDQGDLSVWLMVLQFAYDSETPLGRPFKFKDSDLLKALGKTCGGGMRAKLAERVDRLHEHTIVLQLGPQIFKGQLLSNILRNNCTAEHEVVIDRNLAVFYAEDQLTWVNWKIRLELDAYPLAQWLHCYYSSHKTPYRNRVESLLRWSGSKCKYFVSENPDEHRAALRSACQTLHKALDQVTRACALHGATFLWDEKDKKISAKLTFDEDEAKCLIEQQVLHAA
jgi:hypothetical protein